MRQKLENSSLTGKTQETLGMLDKYLPTKKELGKTRCKGNLNMPHHTYLEMYTIVALINIDVPVCISKNTSCCACWKTSLLALDNSLSMRNRA
jgi:hypothetical protein